MTMTNVNISNVKMGVWMKNGNLTVNGGTISEVQTGITMTGGGRLMVNEGTRITFTSGGTRNYGIGVGGEVTANITGAEITGSGSGKGTGVYATGAKAVTMEEVRISNVSEGVEAKGGILAMKGGSIGFMGEYGISLNQGGGVLKDVRMIYTGSSPTADFIKVVDGTVIAEGIKIDGNGYGQGMSVTQKGHVVLIKPNYINVDKGMTVSEGIVRMFGGEIGFTGDYGVYLKKGGAALIAVTIKGNRTGKTGIKLNEGRIDLYKTNIRDVHKGMTITEGIVRMEGGSMEFKGDYGVYLTKSIAALKNVRITGPSNKGTGVYVQSGVGAVMMKEVRISEVEKGVEVISGNLMMHKGSVAFNGGHGVSLIGGNAALKDVNITGQDHETEVAVKALMGTVAIKGGEMSNVGTGVEATNGGAVWLVDTSLRDVYKGVSVEDGVVHMEGGEIGFMGERGVSLTRGQALLDDVSITGPGDEGTGCMQRGRER
ncbi:hypothetical protein BBbe_01810 [Bartonella bovis 91-4]|uniref:Right handed beta helix domain-containing protein n=1 Tax=Bartonella bovis 91-4 TaxID=1094491 RepID=N6VGM4_9HYPH|nr:hypothetical protein [Bartonella bovis]ENN92910.1 hypothetical protein BBbe_01810 [Bartonella bovis 91-4]